MKVVHINSSDIHGGAARAAYRIHKGLSQAGNESIMMVASSGSGDRTVNGPSTSLQKGVAKFRQLIGQNLTKPFFKTQNPNLHSAAIFNSGRIGNLNVSDAEIINLHWVQGEMLSVSDIGQLTKPLVWTLHDMWAFSGAEHYSEDTRWRDGYLTSNRPSYERGFDLNRWTWKRKRKQWKNPIQIVAPSRWLARMVNESALMKEWPVTVIPNCLDTNKWRPIEKELAREILGLPSEVPLVLFGAVGGTKDPRKGFDLLANSLKITQTEIKGLELVVFGQLEPRRRFDLEAPVHYTGHLHDDISLRVLYSSADLIVVPSRQEVFGQTASEAHACGTPVVAFDTSGLSDIVKHKITGYLATPFDCEDLAQGICWTMEQTRREKSLRECARIRAVENFESSVVADQYVALYNRVLDSKAQGN